MIVAKKLRDWVGKNSDCPTGQLMLQAAAEIDRLKDLVAMWRKISETQAKTIELISKYSPAGPVPFTKEE